MPASPLEVLRRYLEVIPTREDLSGLVTGPRAKTIQLRSESAQPEIYPSHARVHILDLGPERIEGSSASVDFRALHERIIQGPAGADPVHSTAIEMSGPGTFRRIDDAWRLEDFRSDGRTAREALRAAEGTGAAGAIRVEALAVLLWTDMFEVFLRVRNDLQVPIAIRPPRPHLTYRQFIHASLLPKPDIGGSTPPPWIGEEASQPIEMPPNATTQVGWSYGASLPLWAKRFKLTVEVSDLRGHSSGMRISVRLRPFPEDALDGQAWPTQAGGRKPTMR